jgi:LysR family transcriptional regulator, glycine cleavage system transcriptional activator
VCMSKCQIPDLRLLKTFEAAARHRSIKLAGDELHVSRVAVSRSIRKLERELGFRLFDRYHRRIALTDAGEMLLIDVAGGLSQFQNGIVRLKANRSSERLVISVDPDFAGLWLVPRLDDFFAFSPNTPVEISSEKTPGSLDDPRIDCAIHYAKAGLHLENAEPLFRSRLFPVCAPGRRQASLRSPEDLRHHLLLHDRSFIEWQEFLQDYPPTVDIDLRTGPIFNQTALCMEAAARGQGIAIGDDFLAAMHLSEGRLVTLFDSGFHSANAYYLIVPKRASRHPAVAIFRKWLFQSIDRHRSDRRIACFGQRESAAVRR